MRSAILLSLLLASSSLLAYSGSSLTWQKLALEEKVQNKFKNVVSSVLKENQYLIEVEAEVNEPSAPNFGDNGHKSGPRVSDINLSESRGDYIAFSKIGLEVPVLEKFLDEDRTKLMNLYRFNETYDLFKNITNLKVTVFLSEKLPEDLVEIVKRLVQNSRISVSGVKPNVRFENLAMEWVDPETLKKPEPEEPAKPPVQEEPKIWAKDWYEWASRWGNAVGIILGAIIIGTIALYLFKQWKALMESLAPKPQANEETEKQKENEEQSEMVNMAAPDTSSQEEIVAATEGFERFHKCLEQHPEEAITVVKCWLNEAREHDLLALRAIAQQSTPEQFDQLMNGLSPRQRDQWKDYLGHHLDSSDLNIANKHVFQEVVKSFLAPSKIKDGELLNLIMELNAPMTCKFFREYSDQVAVLMNILSPGVISRLLSEVDDATAEKWLIEATFFQSEQLEAELPILKEKLKAFKEINTPSPFAHRIISMIPTATPAKEKTLFRALAKAGSVEMVEDTARRYFPNELLLQLPGTFIKEVMFSYPMAKRIELIGSRTADEQEMILSQIAEEGTTAREMLDMELESLKLDAIKEADVRRRADEIWNEFVKVSRHILANNPAYSSSANDLINTWAKRICSSLKVVGNERVA